jgi:hypothetical protein
MLCLEEAYRIGASGLRLWPCLAIPLRVFSLQVYGIANKKVSDKCHTLNFSSTIKRIDIEIREW